ncbi:hypothetical protein FKM82_015762 [Ascaphus truei]
MALPMGSRLWRSALRFSPIYLLRPQCQHRGLLRLSPTGSPFLARKYSADPGPRRVVVVGVPNPLIWCRSRVYFFLIRAYFDRDFSIEEFTEGAKQAFTLVSKLLSQCNFDALENLVTSEALQNIKEKCSLLSDNHRNALAAISDDIMYTTTGDVGIYYDDNDPLPWVPLYSSHKGCIPVLLGGCSRYSLHSRCRRIFSHFHELYPLFIASAIFVNLQNATL